MPSGPTVTFSRLLWDVFISGCPCASHQPAAFCRFPLVLLLPFLAFICVEVSRSYQLVNYSIPNISWSSNHEIFNSKSLMVINSRNLQIQVYHGIYLLSNQLRYPFGFLLCHLQASSHILSMPYCASQPSSSFAFVQSA